MTLFVAAAVVTALIAFLVGWKRHDTSIIGALGFALPFCFALVLSGLALGVPGPGQCRPGEQDQEVVPPMSTSLSAQELKIRDARDAQIALGSSPGPARAAIGLDTGLAGGVPSPATVAVTVDSFRRDDNPQVTAAVHPHAAFTSGQRIMVWVCVERASAAGRSDDFKLDPGIYTGSMTINDPRLPATTIPFTVTLSFPNAYWPLLPWCGVLLVGAAYLAVIRRPVSGGSPGTKFGFASIVEFLGDPPGLAATVAGGAAALGVYVSSCLTNPTWATSTSDWLGLTAGMFGAFVAAGTAFRFATALDTGTGTKRGQPAPHPEHQDGQGPAEPPQPVGAGAGAGGNQV